jgi:hypothetical protein
VTGSSEERRLLLDLRELNRIEPNPERAALAMERARLVVRERFAERTIRLPQRRVWKWAVKAGGIAAIATTVVVAAVFVLGPSPRENLAFGQVQKQVEQTKSVQYLQTRKDRDRQGRKAPGHSRKVMILGAHQVREEVTRTTDGDPLPEGHQWVTGPARYVMVQDFKTGIFLSLYPEDKLYSIDRRILSIDADTGEIQESQREPMPEADFYRRFRDLPIDRAQKLPDRILGGRKTAVFQIVEKHEGAQGIDTWTHTYWIDPQTMLPVRMETSIRSTNPRMGDSDFVQTDFIFDAPLDQALFSTDPPADYKDIAEAAK